MTRNRFLLLMAFASTCMLGGQALRGHGLEQYQVTAYLLVLATLLILFLVFRAIDRRRQRREPQ